MDRIHITFLNGLEKNQQGESQLAIENEAQLHPGTTSCGRRRYAVTVMEKSASSLQTNFNLHKNRSAQSDGNNGNEEHRSNIIDNPSECFVS